MADATPKDVIEEIQTVLDNNISDPNPDRTGTGKWIYTIPINYDIASYPRIHIHDISSTHEGLSIGSTERWMENRIQISIFHGTGDGHKLDIDGDDEREPVNRIVDYLANQVITQVNDNQSTWNSLGDGENVFNALTIEEQRRQDDKNSVIQHDIDVLIKMAR